MTMMASGAGDNPYDQHDTIIEQDLLEDGKPLSLLPAVLHFLTEYSLGRARGE
jgi:hypothetical protein